MKNVSTTSFANDSALISVNANDRVFVGYTSSSSPGWVTIRLQKQFVYKARSGNHLLVAIYDSTGSYVSNCYFRRFTTSSNTSIRYMSDSYNPNPEASLSNYRGNKYRYQDLPVMKINYTYDTAATLPYTTNFSDIIDDYKWSIRNFPQPKNACWYIFPNLTSPSMLMCGYGQDDYFQSGSPTTNIVERSLQLGYSDSIKVQFNLNVGGESGSTYAFDYLSVFMIQL